MTGRDDTDDGRIPANPTAEGTGDDAEAAGSGSSTVAGPEPEIDDSDPEDGERRDFLTRASRLAMAAGLVGGYGGFAAIAGRYLYPAGADERIWQFVTEADAMAPGDNLVYVGPSGETINVTRQERRGTVDDFIALSSTCPHLGCQVHWEAQNDRFFCPCHNGTFDPSGKATGGPPGEAGQSLPRYPLKIEGGLLYIGVPPARLASGEPDAAAEGRVVERVVDVQGPGHDPCLAPRHAVGRRDDGGDDDGRA